MTMSIGDPNQRDKGKRIFFRDMRPEEQACVERMRGEGHPREHVEAIFGDCQWFRKLWPQDDRPPYPDA